MPLHPSTVCYSDGGTYDGEWRDGREHGEGRYESADGALYVGQWESGRWHGAGKYNFANGDVYEGDYNKNEMHMVEGKFTDAAGNMYAGQWAHGNFHGQGTYNYVVRWVKVEAPALEEGTRVKDNEYGTGTITSVKQVKRSKKIDAPKEDEYTIQWDVPPRAGLMKPEIYDSHTGIEKEIEPDEVHERMIVIFHQLPAGTRIRNKNVKHHTEHDVGVIQGCEGEEEEWKYDVKWESGVKKTEHMNRHNFEKDILASQILLRAGGEVYEGQWKNGITNGQSR